VDQLLSLVEVIWKDILTSYCWVFYTFEIFEQQVNDLQQQQRNVSEEDSQKQFSTNCIQLAEEMIASTLCMDWTHFFIIDKE